MGEVVVQGCFRTETPVIVRMGLLTVVQVAASDACRVAELVPRSLDFGEQIHAVVVHGGDGRNIARVFIVRVFLVVVEAGRKGKGLQPVFIDGFAQQGVGASVHIVTVRRTFVVTVGGLGADVCAHGIEGKRLPGGELLEVVEVEHRTAALALLLFEGGVCLCPVYNLFLTEIARHVTEVAAQ